MRAEPSFFYVNTFVCFNTLAWGHVNDYVLIDWVGGPDGKIFGSRSGRTSLNRTWLHKIRRLRARNNYMKVSTTKVCHYQFLRVKQESHNSSKNTIHVLIFVHAKKPTESWHKAVKNMSSHQKLSEWQKVAPRFTEIVYKSLSEDSRKCRRRFKLFVDLLDSLKQGTTEQLNIYDTCWLLQTVPGFADFAGVVIKHKRVFILIWMNLYSHSVLSLQIKLIRPGSYVAFLPCRIQFNELNSAEIRRMNQLPHFCRTFD